MLIYTLKSLSNETLANILVNLNLLMKFNPNKLLTADDRDPPCITKKIKKNIKRQNSTSNTLKTQKERGLWEQFIFE